jgi:hypothetical protein
MLFVPLFIRGLIMNNRFSVIWSEEDEKFVGLCESYPSLSWLAEYEEDALTGIQKLVKAIEDEMQTLQIQKKLLDFINEAKTSFFWVKPNCLSLRLWSTYSLDIYSFKGDSIFTWEDFINSVQKQYPSPKDLMWRLEHTNSYVIDAFFKYGVVNKVVSEAHSYEY